MIATKIPSDIFFICIFFHPFSSSPHLTALILMQLFMPAVLPLQREVISPLHITIVIKERLRVIKYKEIFCSREECRRFFSFSVTSESQCGTDIIDAN